MSRRGKPVAFAFYGQDWLADSRVRVLSDAARSCFVDLLCHAHADRGIFVEPDKVRRLLSRPRRGWAAIWSELEPFWPRVGDRIRLNPKMAQVIADQEQKRHAGGAGGDKRAANAKQNASKAQANVNPPSPSPSPPPEKNQKKKNPTGGARTPRRRKEPEGDHHEAIRHWCAEWERTRLGQTYVVEGAKDGAAVAKMLKRATLEEIRARMTTLLESSDQWTAENASIALCASKWNQLAVQVRKGRGGKKPDYLDQLLLERENPNGEPETGHS